MKSLYSKKGAEQDPTRTKCLQWITLNLLIHCHLPLIPAQSTLEFLAVNAWGAGNAHARAGCGPQAGYKWKFSLSLNATWDGHCQTQAMLWGRHWAGCDSPWHHLHMRNVWDTEGQAERERRTEQSTIPWNLGWEGCVSLEINFHQNAPPNDWQLHPRTQTRYKNTQAIPQTFIK